MVGFENLFHLSFAPAIKVRIVQTQGVTQHHPFKFQSFQFGYGIEKEIANSLTDLPEDPDCQEQEYQSNPLVTRSRIAKELNPLTYEIKRDVQGIKICKKMGQ